MTDNSKLPEEHPSYGKVKICKVHSNNHPLVGSDILHNSFIELTISRAYLERRLHSDWFHSREELISIELSPTQWSELLSSFNSEGVPCTLNYIAGQPKIPEAPFIDKTKEFSEEFSQEFSDNLSNSLELIHTLIKGLDKDTKLGKKEMRELLNSLYYKVYNIKSNVNFAANQFNKNLENRITCAKEQLESYLKNKYPGFDSIPKLNTLENIPKMIVNNEEGAVNE